MQNSRTNNKRARSHLVSQMTPKTIPSQDCVIVNISRESEISTCNTLCFSGPTKLLAETRKTSVVAILFFKMRPKVLPGKIVMNISCKFENSTCNTLASRGLTCSCIIYPLVCAGQSAPVLQLLSNTHMRTCDTVVKRPTPCASYGVLKIFDKFKIFASDRLTLSIYR